MGRESPARSGFGVSRGERTHKKSFSPPPRLISGSTQMPSQPFPHHKKTLEMLIQIGTYTTNHFPLFFPHTCPTLTSSSCSPPSSSPISAWRSAPCIAKTSSRPRFAKRPDGEWPPPEEEEEEEGPLYFRAASTSRGRWRPTQPPPPDTRAGIAKASPIGLFGDIFCQILGWLIVKIFVLVSSSSSSCS